MTLRTTPHAAGSGQTGFTILELLVASVIMIVALLGIAAVLPTADMTIHQSGQMTKAISLAQEMIEAVRNDSANDPELYDGVNTTNSSTFPPDVGTTFFGTTTLNKWKNDINLVLAPGAGITNGVGTIDVSIVTSNTAGATILRKVTVTVSWTERGRNSSVVLSSLLSAL